MTSEFEADAAAWRRAVLATVCDTVDRWDHGHVFITRRYPDYWDCNVVQVEGDPGLGAAELAAVADEKLADFRHRRIDFVSAEAADRIRADLEAAGWKATRLLWMHHDEPLPPGSSLAVEEVEYDAVAGLRAAWTEEDFPGVDQGDHAREAREVSMTRDVRVIASREAGELVGFAQLEYIGTSAEITHVYVSAERRGSGRGTAMTRAAIEAAGDVQNLWIVADDEDRPKQLYGRLGFRPAWTSVEFLRMPRD